MSKKTHLSPTMQFLLPILGGVILGVLILLAKKYIPFDVLRDGNLTKKEDPIEIRKEISFADISPEIGSIKRDSNGKIVSIALKKSKLYEDTDSLSINKKNATPLKDILVGDMIYPQKIGIPWKEALTGDMMELQICRGAICGKTMKLSIQSDKNTLVNTNFLPEEKCPGSFMKNESCVKNPLSGSGYRLIGYNDLRETDDFFVDGKMIDGNYNGPLDNKSGYLAKDGILEYSQTFFSGATDIRVEVSFDGKVLKEKGLMHLINFDGKANSGISYQIVNSTERKARLSINGKLHTLSSGLGRDDIYTLIYENKSGKYSLYIYNSKKEIVFGGVGSTPINTVEKISLGSFGGKDIWKGGIAEIKIYQK